MKLFLVGVVVVLTSLAARANDSSLKGVGGTVRPTVGENKAIRMVRETVVLTARKNDYVTRADFLFSNETGKAQVVSMGFPEGNFGDVNAKQAMKKTGFRGFKTLVDGRAITAKRVLLKEADESGFDTYWAKTVRFEPRQKRHVRVEFSSPYGDTVHWGMTKILSYWFTGKNWRGKVGESVLEVRIIQPGTWRVVTNNDSPRPLTFQVKTTPREAAFRHVWRNWEAQNGVRFGLERVAPPWREDNVGTDDGSDSTTSVDSALTVRVGAKPNSLEATQGYPAQGFTHNGVLYVSVFHLKDRLESWGHNQNPQIEAQIGFSPSTGFDLRAGTTRIQGREGEKTVRVNGKPLALGAPILALVNEGNRYLYLPIAPLSRALGWKVAFKGERLFTLEQGNWRG